MLTQVRSVIALFVLPSLLHASGPEQLPRKVPSQGMRAFIENRGQFMDEHGQPNLAVRYLMNLPGSKVQLHQDGFSYDLYQMVEAEGAPSLPPAPVLPGDQPTEPPGTIDCYRVDLRFVGSDRNAPMEATDTLPHWLNYHTTGCPQEGINLVRSYHRVLQRDIYPLVDVEYLLGADGGFKYNLIVRPGGDLSQVRIRVSDIPSLRVTEQGLHLETPLVEVLEQIPSCSMVEDGSTREVKGRFILTGPNEVGIALEETIPKGATVVIDPVPTFVWGSFFGGENHDVALDLYYDNDGSLYLGGSTASFNYIATSGVYQDTHSSVPNDHDGLIARFDTNGQLVWATYYGHSNGWDGFQMLDGHDWKLYFVAGGSSTTMQTMWPTFLWNGNLIGYIGKPSGAYIKSTTIPIGPNDMHVNDSDQVYIGGTLSGIGNNHKGAIGKFDISGVFPTMIWADTLPGSFVQALCLDDAQDVYGAGWRISVPDTFPIPSPGALQTAPSHAFAFKYDPNGTQVWCTNFGGPGADIQPMNVAVHDRNLFIHGFVHNYGTYETSTNAFMPSVQMPYQAVQFMEMIDTSGTYRFWGSYLPRTDSGASVLKWKSDEQGNLFNATSGLNYLVGDSAFFDAPSGLTLSKWGKDGFPMWATSLSYPGFPADHGPIEVRNGLIACGSVAINFSLDTLPFPAWQSSPHGGREILLAVYADCLDVPAQPPTPTGPSFACPGESGLQFGVNSWAGMDSVRWWVPNGAVITANQGDTLITVTMGSQSGNIELRAVGLCGPSTPAVHPVTVGPSPSLGIVVQGDTVFCAGDSVQLEATGASSVLWSDGVTGLIRSVDQPASLSFQVTDTLGCTFWSDTVNLSIAPPFQPTLDVVPDSLFCAGDSVQLVAGGAFQVLWSDGDSAFIRYADTTGTYSVTGFDEYGCVSPGPTVYVQVSVLSEAEILGPDLVNVPDTQAYHVAINPPVDSLVWNVVGGTILAGQGTDSVVVEWNLPGSGMVGLTQWIPPACEQVDTLGVALIDASGLEEHGLSGLTIYPNPAQQSLWLESSGMLPSDLHYEVLDITGRVLVKGMSPEQRERLRIDLTGMASGHYLLKLGVGPAVLGSIRFVVE